MAPSRSVEVTSDQVHVLFQHHGVDSEEKLLPDSTLVGLVVLDVQRHYREEFLATARLPTERCS